MVFFKSQHAVAALATAVALEPSKLNIDDDASIRGVAKTLAEGSLAYYSGTADKFVDLAAPYYWWEAGAFMGAMMDYSYFTKDDSYDQIITTALLANVGPNYDYISPEHHTQEGNDDQQMWALGIMAAAERNFPMRVDYPYSWLGISENIFNNLISRWDTSACGGGLRWQMYADNANGLNYKNSVANGGLFDLAARLARATGNQTYVEWADKVWQWSRDVKFVDDQYKVRDGAGADQQCKDIQMVTFTYNAGFYLHGCAVMANITGDGAWADRSTRLLEGSRAFFTPPGGAQNVMYENACEQHDSCNADMKVFKGVFSRFLYTAAVLQSSLQGAVNELMHPSAMAAAKACSGGKNGTECGQKWYTGGFDGNTGLGQSFSALQAVQGLLAAKMDPPLDKDKIKDVRVPNTGTKKSRAFRQ